LEYFLCFYKAKCRVSQVKEKSLLQLCFWKYQASDPGQQDCLRDSHWIKAQCQKSFHFSLLFLSRYFLIHTDLLISFIKRSNVDHSKSSFAIVLGDSVSLDFITFTVPKEVKKEVIYLYYNLRINLKKQKKNYLGGKQTLKNCYFPDKA